MLAVYGSINALKHLQAVAVEAGTKVDIYAIWRELQGKVPILSAPRPTGEVRIEEFEDAGACEAVLLQLGPMVDRSVLTCTGKTLADNLRDVTVKDAEIIRPLDNPVSVGPAIAVLRGSLAPPRAPSSSSASAAAGSTSSTGPRGSMTTPTSPCATSPPARCRRARCWCRAGWG